MIEILKAGLLSTVQDLGRTGSRHLGVISAGAMDQVALRVANRLVGNEDDAAAIEITAGLPFSVVFRQATRIALTGADCRATLDGTPIHAWWSVPVAAGQTLALQSASHAMRAYLGVAGGIAVPLLLGSRSTDLKTAFGGANGRALADGDTLAIGEHSAAQRDVATVATTTTDVSTTGTATAQQLTTIARAALRAALDQPAFGVKSPAWCRLAYAGALPSATAESTSARGNGAEALVVRVIPAAEYTMFDAAAQQAFWHADWTITPNSNRMGYRLSGPALKRTAKANDVELLSHAVLPGTIQVPPNGQPILLMGDAQTAGGYPKIGAVVTADLWLLAQARLTTTIGFVQCTRADALEAQRALLRYLAQVDIAIARRPVQRETKRAVAHNAQPDNAHMVQEKSVAPTTSTPAAASSGSAKQSKPTKTDSKNKKERKEPEGRSIVNKTVPGNIGELIMALSDTDAELPVSELVSELLSGVLKD